jgi:RND family efflux transporter MFP subunit
VAARRELSLGFTTAGKIKTLAVNEGDRVRKGQLLAALDSDQVGAALSAAIAEERRAEADYRRIARLSSDGWVTQSRLDGVKAALESARAGVQARRFAADTARIVAPHDGMILARLAEPNEVIAAGMPVVVLGDAAGGYVLRAPLADREAAQITAGAPARVWLEALGIELSGKIIELAGRADRATGAFQIEISLPSHPALRSGLIGQAQIMRANNAAPRALKLPATALYAARAGEGFVYVIDASNHARLKKVQLGDTDDEGTEVLSGVRAGERVAVSSLDRLRDGIAVTPEARAK